MSHCHGDLCHICVNIICQISLDVCLYSYLVVESLIKSLVSDCGQFLAPLFIYLIFCQLDLILWCLFLTSRLQGFY